VSIYDCVNEDRKSGQNVAEMTNGITGQRDPDVYDRPVSYSKI